MSPSIPLLIGSDSPLSSGPVTIAGIIILQSVYQKLKVYILESSLIGSMSCIGGFIATFFYGWVNKKIINN